MNSPVNIDFPLVSILIPTYNSAAYLPAVCQSIQNQTYSNFEVVILDDGSTDQTMSVLAPFKKDSRFQIRSWSPNRGLNAAWREILTLARGKYWVSPGADDVLMPEFLQRRVALMEAHPEAVMAHGGVQLINEKGDIIPNLFPQVDCPVQLGTQRALEMVLQHDIINQPSNVVRSDVTRKVLPYYVSDWKFSPDWHLWILLLSAGGDMLWDARPSLQYRVHGNSLSRIPRLAAVRSAEIRLVPLCALKAAAAYSQLAHAEWLRWGATLYRLWLLRAARLRSKHELRQEWLDLAGEAYYGRSNRHLNLWHELLKHGLGAVLAFSKQYRAVKKQSFRVSGLAEIDDPVFKMGAAGQ